jgi:hypothetical protein
MQMGPLLDKRAEYRRDFVDSVAPVGLRGDPDVVAACCKSVAAAQRQLWKLRWDNHYKEFIGGKKSSNSWGKDGEKMN